MSKVVQDMVRGAEGRLVNAGACGRIQPSGPGTSFLKPRK